jgi:isopenicillin N synthase-like dioxygenase
LQQQEKDMSASATATPSTSLGTDAIPVIDVGALAGDDIDAIRATGLAMRHASETIGFFYVKNHGISGMVICEAFRSSQTFFRWPHEKKSAYAVNGLHRGFIGTGGATMVGEKKPDLKESFVWGLELPETDSDVVAGKPLMGPNQWPKGFPEFRRDIYAYYTAACGLGERLLKGLAVSLDQSPDTFAKAFSKPLARGGTIFYPSQTVDENDRFGVAPHTDYGGLTLLAQDNVGGLEVKALNGEWVKAVPMPGTIVVNVGDLMGRWTNDRFHSNSHRVVNASGRERQSIAVFFDPHPDTVIDPADLLADRSSAKYPPITCGDYILDRFAKVFTYRKG